MIYCYVYKKKIKRRKYDVFYFLNIVWHSSSEFEMQSGKNLSTDINFG